LLEFNPKSVSSSFFLLLVLLFLPHIPSGWSPRVAEPAAPPARVPDAADSRIPSSWSPRMAESAENVEIHASNMNLHRKSVHQKREKNNKSLTESRNHRKSIRQIKKREPEMQKSRKQIYFSTKNIHHQKRKNRPLKPEIKISKTNPEIKGSKNPYTKIKKSTNPEI
jgi:hypothetical protein